MRILALETTEAVGTVAALEGDHPLGQLRLDSRQQSARSLAPGIQQLLQTIGWQPHDVELVAVTRGPGSFTGLRVGLATAKAFAYATGAQILGVDTLEAIAANAPDTIDRLAVAVDAQRGQVVAGRFQRGSEGFFFPIGSAELVELNEWLNGLDRSVHLSGPILRKYASQIPTHLSTLAPDLWSPQAVQVGRLAARDWASGRRDDLWSISPIYSRRSAAEEKWGKRDRGQAADERSPHAR